MALLLLSIHSRDTNKSTGKPLPALESLDELDGVALSSLAGSSRQACLFLPAYTKKGAPRILSEQTFA